MLNAVETYLFPLGVSLSIQPGRIIAGGYFLWLLLPNGLAAEEVARRAEEQERLLLAPGNIFEVWGDDSAERFASWVRVCFMWETEERLVEGIKRFGNVVKRMLKVC